MWKVSKYLLYVNYKLSTHINKRIECLNIFVYISS